MTAFYEQSPETQARAYEVLARQALALWDLQGAALAPVKLRENAVFRVEDAGGRRYALRIHRHGYHSDAELRSELQWMQALAAAGIAVPRVLPSAAGRLHERVAAAAVPEARQVDLFEWIAGEPIGAAGEALAAGTGEVRALFEQMGALCARVHDQSAAWQPPPGFVRHRWDAEGLTGEQPFWGRFWELGALAPAERELILAGRARVHEALLACGKAPARYSLIHADLTPDNVMARDGELLLIDFDDAGWGWHLFELATALYFHVGEPYYAAALEALVAGYRRHRPLAEDDLARLPVFLAARGFTYLGWVHTRSETETARELTPELIARCCSVTRALLEGRAAPGA